MESGGIGFGATVRSKQERSLTQVFADVEPEDLIKYGMIPELVGRMPVVTKIILRLNESTLLQLGVKSLP